MSSNKKMDKNPFQYHSEKDVALAETNRYVIQIGDDLLTTETGMMAFSKERAENLYDQALAGLIDLSKHGSEDEKVEAKQRLMNFRMHPFRIN